MKYLLLIACIFCSACTTSKLSLYSPTLGKYNFNYNIESASKTGVIQVFDDGKNTYFKLYSQNRKIKDISFHNSNTKKLLKATPVQGNLIMIFGLYDKIYAKSRGLKTYVTRLKPETNVGTRCKSTLSCQL